MPMRSPPRSSDGPAVVTMVAPISLARMVASVVLPRPGGPERSTLSSGSPRGLARHPQALDGCALADVLVEPLGTQLALKLRLLRQRHAAHDPRLVGHE